MQYQIGKWIISVLFGFVLLNTIQAADLPAAYVTRVQGVARAQSAESTATPRKLILGKPVFEGDRLRTEKGARLELRLRDGTIMTLGERTEFIVQTVSSDSKADSSTLMELVEGVFRAVTPKSEHRQSLQIRTSVATIGIRGTTFWGGFLFQPGVLDVVMLKGKGIYVENQGGRVDLTTPGKGTSVNDPNKPPTSPDDWRESKLRTARYSISWR